jgi:hypothetical protein
MNEAKMSPKERYKSMRDYYEKLIPELTAAMFELQDLIYSAPQNGLDPAELESLMEQLRLDVQFAQRFVKEFPVML